MGPSLGQDSIHKGIVSTLISATVVVLFMVFYYRVSGVIADTALVLNVVLTLATLALFRATLTLPGIAGFGSFDRNGGGCQYPDSRKD